MNVATRRGSGWIAAVVGSLLFLALDSSWRLDQLRIINDVRLADCPDPPIVDANSLTGYRDGQRRLILPPNGVDGYQWIIQTQLMLAGDGLRIRDSDYDNVAGREVHWSSLPRWWLALVAWFESRASGMPWAASVERVAPYANTLLQVVFLLALVPVVARRFGGAAAGLVAVGMVAVYPFYNFFMIGSADHHGIVTTFAFMTVLFLIGGGGGWVRNSLVSTESWDAWLPEVRQARRWFVASGVSGGAGLWISAATESPVLLGIGVAALILAFWPGDTGPWRREPLLWRWWGWAGAASSLFFYLLEYFPQHMGMRLEVNHPFYALTFLGGGEFLFRMGQRQLDWLGLTLSIVAVAVLPVTIFLAPERTFWVADPFLWRLHEGYIAEFLPATRLFQESILLLLHAFNVLPLIVGLLMLVGLCRREVPGPIKGLFLLVLGPGLIYILLALGQQRWTGVMCGVGLAGLATLALVGDLLGYLHRAKYEVLAALVLLPILLPNLWYGIDKWRQPRSELSLSSQEVAQRILRDASYWLRQRLGDERGNVLCGPSSNNRLIYFGRPRCVGTLYWENMFGLKDAAAMYAVPSQELAREVIERAGVTHVIVFDLDGFTEPYVRLIRGLDSNQPVPRDAFMVQMSAGTTPAWLRPLCFPGPAFAERSSLVIFEVDFRQTAEEADVRWAQRWLWAKDYQQAEQRLQQALERRPGYPLALIRLAQTAYHLNRRAEFHQRVAQLNPVAVDRLALEDRLALAQVYHLADQPSKVQAILAGCEADAGEWRRLEPFALRQWLQMIREHAPQPDLEGRIERLLPAEWRKK